MALGVVVLAIVGYLTWVAITSVNSAPFASPFRVNAVVPQLLDTPANRAMFPAEALANATQPEAVASVISFLAGDLAAPVSGAIVPAYGA